MDDLMNRLIEIFNDAGIYLDENDLDAVLELDSLHYVSVLCEIEDEFDIEIPDEKLTVNPLMTLNDFYNLIKEG